MLFLRVCGQAFGIHVVVGHLQAGKERGLESEGGLGSVLFVGCVRGSADPEVCGSALMQFFFCSGRIAVGGTPAYWSRVEVS